MAPPYKAPKDGSNISPNIVQMKNRKDLNHVEVAYKSIIYCLPDSRLSLMTGFDEDQQ